MTDVRGPAVSDSTPLIYLAKIGRLSLLSGVFKSIYVPEAVFNEAVSQGKALNMIDAFIIEKAVGD
jgi:predicted nucleic acid-binding protein